MTIAKRKASKKYQTVYISLVSQTKTQIKIEVLADEILKAKNDGMDSSIEAIQKMKTIKADSHGCISQKEKDLLDSQ